jgi:hypothetical protein
MAGNPVELSVMEVPAQTWHSERMEAYERLLGDAMTGDATLFARQDVVEAAWAVVDPMIRTPMPVIEYEPGTWGPAEAEPMADSVGGWITPGRDERAPAPAAADVAPSSGSIPRSSSRIAHFWQVVAAGAHRARDALSRSGRFDRDPGRLGRRAFLPRLARVPLDPTTVEVFWVDERAVPLDDPVERTARPDAVARSRRIPA